METVQEGRGRLQNGSTVATMPNRLKLVQSDENDKVTSEKAAEMDPYRELELYLAKVKVSQLRIRTFTFLVISCEKLCDTDSERSKNFAIIKPLQEKPRYEGKYEIL